jgi:prepilin-type N-terminal cleavage/methylation domain-containing protein
MNRSRGVTLIELLVTIIVLAILATIAFPGFRDLAERRRLINATEAFYAEVQFARSEAVKRSRSLTVNVADSCLTIAEASASPALLLTSTCIALFPAISLAATGMPMALDPVRGIPSPTGGTLVLTSPSGLETRVIVSRFGRVRICSPATKKVGGYPSC